MDRQAAAGVSEEIRCPSCARPLVLRSGPQITPHFAHRPRQSCRRRPGPAPVTPLRLEQLTLFDVAPLTAPPPVPVFYFGARPVPMQPAVPAPHASPRPATPRRRRRRRAWLPRLMDWFRIRAGSA